MSSGKPSATVVNMRNAAAVIKEEKPDSKPKDDKVFCGIFERDT